MTREQLQRIHGPQASLHLSPAAKARLKPALKYFMKGGKVEVNGAQCSLDKNAAWSLLHGIDGQMMFWPETAATLTCLVDAYWKARPRQSMKLELKLKAGA